MPAVPPYGAGGYAFLRTAADGTPVAFDPCRPVHYVVRAEWEPEDGDALLGWALGELSRATGLRFVAGGTTDEAITAGRSAYQPARYGDRWAPVLVTWSAGGPGSELEDPAVLGRAGPDWAGTGEPGSERYVSGVATFHGPRLQRLLDTGQEDRARSVLLHELGHLVGLAHVADPYQVMHPVNAAPLPNYRQRPARAGAAGPGSLLRRALARPVASGVHPARRLEITRARRLG